MSNNPFELKSNETSVPISPYIPEDVQDFTKTHMTDKAKTVKRNKKRGYKFEYELVKDAERHGLIAERAWGSNGRALGFHESVDLSVSGCRVQAKRCKTIANKFKPNAHQDAVAFREDFGETLITIRYEDFLKLIKSAGGW